MMIQRLYIAAAVAGALFAQSGCSRSSENKGADKAAAAAGAPASNPAGDPAGDPAGAGKDKKPAAPPVAPIAEADVRAFLDTWLAAQNGGDFAAYEALYAKRFGGVRRSGAKVVRLDRKGWVAERQRMFKRKMEVEMSDVDIDSFSQSAIVTFTQRWASGKYEDVGPKQMVIAREDGALRIAREEMLASTLVGGVKETDLADEGFVFIIQEGNDTYAVLDSFDGVTPGALTLVDQGDPVVVEAKISAKELPVAVARWRGQELGDDECSAKIGEILAVSRVVPHFGERQVWSGEMDENEPYSEEQIAEAAFHDQSAYLVGRLEFKGGDCDLGPFAAVKGKPGPVAGDAPIDPAVESAVRKAAVAAFRALPLYAETQKDFEGYDRKGRWEDSEGADGPTVTISRHPDKQTLQVVITAHAGVGCGDFEGSMIAFFNADVSGKKPRLEHLADSASQYEIKAALDVDHDGVLEYLAEGFYTTVLLGADGEQLREVSVAFLDCGC